MAIPKFKKDLTGQNFGKYALNYELGRKGFPESLFLYLRERFTPESSVLDLGCGTGIGTRELARFFHHVTGCDCDELMIAKAKEKGQKEIHYDVQNACSTEYKDETFDIVTAFSSFHWFQEEKYTNEILRILKPQGLLFAVNKKDIGKFREQFQKIASNICQVELQDPKHGYNPVKVLQNAGFVDVFEKKWEIVEEYSEPEAINFFQSMSIWNEVPDSLKPQALIKAQDHIRYTYPNGIVTRSLEVVAVGGYKS